MFADTTNGAESARKNVSLPAGSTPQEKFLRHLGEHVPQTELNIIWEHFNLQMMAVSTQEQAKTLLARAKRVLTPTICDALREQRRINVVLFSPPSSRSRRACFSIGMDFDNGVPILLKSFDHHVNSDLCEAQLVASRILTDAKAHRLVPVRGVTVTLASAASASASAAAAAAAAVGTITKEEEEEEVEEKVLGRETEKNNISLFVDRNNDDCFTVLAMPVYIGSIVEWFPNPLSPMVCELLVNHLLDAINYMHSLQLIHCDVQPDNVLLDQKGGFWLGNFGAVTKVGEPICRHNEQFTPAGLTRAEPQLDRLMLVATVLHMVGVMGYARSADELRAACEELLTSDHKSIALRLIELCA